MLVLAPDAGFRVTTAGALREAGFDVHTVGRATAALDLLERRGVELMVVQQQGQNDLGRYFVHQLDALAVPTALLLLVEDLAPFDDLRACRRRVMITEGVRDAETVATVVRAWRPDRGLASLAPISLGDWIDAALRNGEAHRLRVEVGGVAIGQVLVSEGEVVDASLPGARGLAALDVLGRLPQAHVHVEPWRPGRARPAIAWAAVVPTPRAEVRGLVSERLLAGDGPIGRHASVERRRVGDRHRGRSRGPTSVFEAVDGAAATSERRDETRRPQRRRPPPPDESQLPQTLHPTGPHTPLDVEAVGERVRVVSGSHGIHPSGGHTVVPSPSDDARPGRPAFDATELFDLAMDAYVEGCHGAAMRLFEQCLGHAPDHRWARYNLDRMRARRSRR